MRKDISILVMRISTRFLFLSKQQESFVKTKKKVLLSAKKLRKSNQFLFHQQQVYFVNDT